MIPLPPPEKSLIFNEDGSKIISFTTLIKHEGSVYRYESIIDIFEHSKDGHKYELIKNFSGMDLITPRFSAFFKDDKVVAYQSWLDFYHLDWNRPAIWVLNTDGSISCQILYHELFNQSDFNIGAFGHITMASDIYMHENNLVISNKWGLKKIDSSCNLNSEKNSALPKNNHPKNEANDYIDPIYFLSIALSVVVGFILGKNRAN